MPKNLTFISLTSIQAIDEIVNKYMIVYSKLCPSGHKEIVEMLVKYGADIGMKMGDLTPVDIARDFDHPDILSLLEKSAT